jgi:6-phosphofructokinase 1
VAQIQHLGGTILGSSRGGFDAERIVGGIVKHGINQVYVIGGDGTHRGAMALSEALVARGVACSVATVPKTIDNDIPLATTTFGFETAVARAAAVIQSAHTEAVSAPNGVGVVKLMGRTSGFIALHAALASRQPHLVLIPEVPYKLSVVCEWLLQRLSTRDYAVLVIAEGALPLPEDFDVSAPGNDAQAAVRAALAALPKDASGNPVLPDVGKILTAAIGDFFKDKARLAAIGGDPPSVKYIDPSYMVRSVPANPTDQAFCTKLAYNAVHGVMGGFTVFSSCTVDDHGVLIPIKEIATRPPRTVDPTGRAWALFCRSSGQPRLDGTRDEEGRLITPTTADQHTPKTT